MGVYTERNVLNKRGWIATHMSYSYINLTCSTIDRNLQDHGSYRFNVGFDVFESESQWYATIEGIRHEYENAGWKVGVNYYAGRFATVEIM